MLLRFTKMHGLGNDFVVIDAVTQSFSMTPEKARKIANRRFGAGCDQVLVVEPPGQPNVDFRYRIFNADGSEVEQCGNGARCFARFVRERRLTGKRRITVETAAGIIELKAGKNNRYTIDMGAPVLEPSRVPFCAEQQNTTYPLEASGQTLQISAVSMGNPHAVLVVDDIATAAVETLGPVIESHPAFPQRCNVGFMQVVSRNEINLRVYERGVGETLACGTGACAAVVAGRRQDLLDSQVRVNLPGGYLQIAWPGDPHSTKRANVKMTGPATTVFQGQMRI